MEMLVSIAIICVLASLLLPVVTGAKARAKQVVCISNLRQLGLALEMYKSDNGEFPTPWDPYEPYLKGAKLKCPSDTKQGANLASYTSMANARESLNNPMFPDARQKLLECRDLRGPDYPLLWDTNHLPRILRNDDEPGGFAFAYRTSGAVVRVSKQVVAEIYIANSEKKNKNYPCDPRLFLANL
jgi:type II secretory pathway pseudopilin PulG